ncbi:Exosome complex exonuclease dis3 [Astathelohania contejeani]|uniref:Exosome complex exonuclease dis3 n=1 Tax=Astathelohania contejeani TaxID=164912 RepID=A0ABQ7I1D1_9MICR|nr:Exosome complex exonuclease dis3 [Thelohania contejeani]
MIKTIINHKFSKRNKLIRNIRENYIRSDIPCGFPCCMPGKPVPSFQHYVIPTAWVLQKYRSLFETDFVYAIIPRSELEIIKQNSRNEYRRILEVANKHIVFYNDFCCHTYTTKDKVEAVANYYRKHLPHKNFIILNETNIFEYPVLSANPSEIKDLLDRVTIAEQTEYEEYININEIKVDDTDVISEGVILKGILKTSSYNCYSGKVQTKQGEIYVEGKMEMNRAINNDEVLIQVIRQDNFLNLNDDIFPEGENIKWFGKIVCVNKREDISLIGTIDPLTVNGTGPQNVLVIPINRKYPKVRIRTSQVENLLKQRINIVIDSWEKESKYPNGHYTGRIGTIGDKETEIEIILKSHDIDPTNIDDIPIDDGITSSDDISMNYRLDLRNKLVFSIDPPGCTDIDDALHVDKLDNGNYEVGVHIADVTHFVKRKSKIDLEARKRGTTVYLVDRRIDMLPRYLGSDRCSLVEGKDRMAFSVIWEINQQAEIIDYKISRTIIRSRHSYTYEQAAGILRSGVQSPESISLGMLYNIATILRRKRFEAGSLELSGPELLISPDLKIQTKVAEDTNWLVEEFMLLANITVAQFIYNSRPTNCLLRRHPEFMQGSFESLSEELKKKNVNLNFNTSKELNFSIKKIRDPTLQILVKRMITRCMNQAVYFNSGSLPKERYFHYGLATPIYTHFTSPIRRYADVLVHRILEELIYPEETNICPEGLDFEDLNEICSNLNHRNRMAQYASRACQRLFTYLYICQNEHGIEDDANVIKLVETGMVVFLSFYCIEGVIKGEVKNDTFVSGGYKLYDKVRVCVTKDDDMFYLKGRFNIKIVE